MPQGTGIDQEQVTEQTDQVPPPEPEVIDRCHSCGDPILEGSLYQVLDDVYDAEIDRYRIGHRCETCTVNAYIDETYWCSICDEDHIDTGSWEVPDWYFDEYGHMEQRSRYMNSYTSWCVNGTPECLDCGRDADLSEWNGEQEIADHHPHFDEDCDCEDCDMERDLFVPRCRRCSRGVVHNYSFVPPLSFRQVVAGEEVRTDEAITGTPYLGMELEMEDAMPHARKILDLFHGDCENVWLKPDGSLGINGLELVTHPATLDWYKEHFDWDALGELSKLGCRAYHTNTAGIHVHISSDAFTPVHLFKFLAFHHRNPIVCQTIGQRGSANYCSWSRYLMTRTETIKYAKREDYPEDRYVAVNLTERATIELRYFKGNLSPARVRKNLQWVDALYRYTKQVKAAKMAEELDFHAMFSWLGDHADRYPDLLGFITDRNINRAGEAQNINEAVDV